MTALSDNRFVPTLAVLSLIVVALFGVLFNPNPKGVFDSSATSSIEGSGGGGGRAVALATPDGSGGVYVHGRPGENSTSYQGSPFSGDWWNNRALLAKLSELEEVSSASVQARVSAFEIQGIAGGVIADTLRECADLFRSDEFPLTIQDVLIGGEKEIVDRSNALREMHGNWRALSNKLDTLSPNDFGSVLRQVERNPLDYPPLLVAELYGNGRDSLSPDFVLESKALLLSRMEELGDVRRSGSFAGSVVLESLRRLGASESVMQDAMQHLEELSPEYRDAQSAENAVEAIYIQQLRELIREHSQ